VNKIAFIHIVRTGGTFFNAYFHGQLGNRFKVHDSWRDGLRRDWSEQELLSFVDMDSVYVHNHVINWPLNVVEMYLKRGWFLFTFVRHPGDQLCSYYFYFDEGERRDISGLDGFIRNSLKQPPEDMLLPDYWKSLNFVAEFNQQNLHFFLSEYFGCPFIANEKVNTSENLGWQYYCEQGVISQDTQDLLYRSPVWKRYEEVLELDQARLKTKSATV
jgi:hypothetical protein